MNKKEKIEKIPESNSGLRRGKGKETAKAQEKLGKYLKGMVSPA